MADFKHPKNSRCWKDGYEHGYRAFQSGVELTTSNLQKAAEAWWWAASDGMSMRDHLNAQALAAEFAGGFESAYVDCKKEGQSDG